MKKILIMLVALAAFGGLAHGTVFIDTGFEGSTSLPVGWAQITLVIPSASANSRIMFEGNAKYGHGVCLDDIRVTGVPYTIFEVFVIAPKSESNPKTYH